MIGESIVFFFVFFGVPENIRAICQLFDMSLWDSRVILLEALLECSGSDVKRQLE